MALIVSLGSLSKHRKKMNSTMTNRAASPQIRHLRLAKFSIVRPLLSLIEPLSIYGSVFGSGFAFRFEISPLIQRPTFTPPSSTVNPPPTSLSSPPLVDSKDDGVCLANHQRDFPNQIGCMVAPVKSWPSSLNKSFSTSSAEKKTPFLYASNHHSTSYKTLRVRFHLCSYSPLILLLDAYVNMLDLGLDLCSYSPIILDLDVYDISPLVLLWDCSRKYRTFSYSTYNPTIRSLLPCPPWLNPNHIWLRLGLEVPITDDPLSVSFKGSTLISEADYKIVKPVLVAASITEVSSVAVILIFDCVILLLRSYGVKIQGRLYIVCYLSTMIASILCLYFLRGQLVAAILVVLMSLSSSLVNDSSFGVFEA